MTHELRIEVRWAATAAAATTVTCNVDLLLSVNRIQELDQGAKSF